MNDFLERYLCLVCNKLSRTIYFFIGLKTLVHEQYLVTMYYAMFIVVVTIGLFFGDMLQDVLLR